MPVTIKYDRRAASTEAFAILAEAWNELTIEGLTPDGVGTPPYSPDAHVLYAVSNDGDIVGVLVWETREDVADIKLFYVEPSSREAGVFTALFDALRQRVYSMGAKRITTTVTNGTDEVERALVSVGATQIAVTYEVKPA